MLAELCDGDPARLTGPMVTAAAADGDLVARAAFARVGDWLGVGLANLVAAFDPEVVVVGGGVSEAGDRLLEPARDALARSLVGAGHRVVPPVVRAALGPEAGLIGAADLAHGASGQRPAVVGDELERELLEEQPDVGDDAARLRRAAVGELGDGRRVDVDADERDRGRAGCCRSRRSAAWSPPSGRSRRPSSSARIARWPSITSV